MDIHGNKVPTQVNKSQCRLSHLNSEANQSWTWLMLGGKTTENPGCQKHKPRSYGQMPEKY